MQIHAVAGLLVAITACQLCIGIYQRINFFAEGMHAAISRAVNEGDLTACGQRSLQHGQSRRNAHAATDQHQRFAAVL